MAKTITYGLKPNPSEKLDEFRKRVETSENYKAFQLLCGCPYKEVNSRINWLKKQGISEEVARTVSVKYWSYKNK